MRQLADPAARFLPMHNLEPLVKLGDTRSLAWARGEMFDDVLPDRQPLLLGLDEGVAHFAVDVSPLSEPLAQLGVESLARFEEIRGIAGQLSGAEVSVIAHARSLTDWHHRHRHCAACGEATTPMLGGAHRRCAECATEHFPRTDPVAIAPVVHGDRCLLGRGPGWPDTMYSALAGFIEIGETLEEAVRREVFEEVGVTVGAVRYVKSQPWPFPSSLMIGCLAEAESSELTVDHNELADARWFSLDEVRDALAGKPGPLFVPPPFAIAHHLIRAWVEHRDGKR
jgi:NAD+ diphosphatase